MEFNDIELGRILDAIDCLESEAGLDDMLKDIKKRIKIQLKTRACFYFDDNPDVVEVDCVGKDCEECKYYRDNY